MRIIYSDYIDKEPACQWRVTDKLAGSAFNYFSRFFDTQWAKCPCFFEQLREPAGGGAADHLGDLPHGEIGVDEQMRRLTHAAALNVLGDTAPELPLEAAFQLGFAHAGDAGKALQRKADGRDPAPRRRWNRTAGC